ncbi:NirD/YgiW/YdeI family stress tolerance protein [Variovorax sp.]|uniref:YgiW/YdeI family stress tolerance OB fold protein n=1 Tax=Variovorax sp. TaxID=1871043 RepID=UPI002D28B7A1|nr:NirD/YgiW/YdeI family stress tolerance protein [Variovorax sp.]HYP81853.1 NirD/YgiW/YdeI family stress tolerance protein [Variovorax sp.]
MNRQVRSRTARRLAALAPTAGALLLAAFAAAPAAAQYTGPNAVAPVTVESLLKDGRDDQQVVLRGRLLKKVGSDKYEFSDGTGTIRVEIDAKHFPAEPIDDKTQVEIHGEFEKDFMHSPEIDVDVLRRVTGS